METLETITEITPADVERLEGAMLQMEQVELRVEHRFAPGVYIREMHAPAGLWIIGHEHTTEHFNLLLKGRISVLIGSEVKVMTAPMLVKSPANDRKVGLVWEDCIWATIHPTDETNLQKLEDQLIRKSPTYRLHEDEMRRLMEVAS